MEKILLIIQREYWTRVRKRSFIIMSILGPVLIASVYIVPAWLAISGTETQIIEVWDESGLFEGKFQNSDKLFYIYSDRRNSESNFSFLQNDSIDAQLIIPPIQLENPEGIKLLSRYGISAITQSLITNTIEKEIENIKWAQSGIDKKIVDQIKTNIQISIINLGPENKEEEVNTAASTAVGMVGGLLVYFFTFLYGAQVMRGVIEEKTNRIVEVIISSVKPFQLMMGKIIGIAGVGLTQLLIWIILGIFSIMISTLFLGFDQQTISPGSTSAIVVQGDSLNKNGEPAVPENEFLYALKNTIDYPLIIGSFLFFFLFGYLTYAALFGAIGAAVDSETDTQQFMLPITIPLILSIAMSGAVIANPNGGIAFWLSMFPLTSPVITMIRLPFIGASWELFLSMGIQVIGFLAATWMAAKIYRVGILMYGKKITYRELSKWLFFK
ncbi:ABC transporter permease [Flexithrix dorotheae]|uniref:ABC transporter permease n=1 Tax=Flexithrix dorotheae TaxID=70993 RepID=UPI0003A6DD4F|nr:ABC transporter permease [Flexithrix dorotheae]